MEPEMQKSLRAAQESRGARFCEYAGRTIPAVFGDVEAECSRVRASAGLIDLTWHSLLRFTGPDAASFLHNMSTNHVLDLQPGDAQRNTLCNVTAHLVALFRLCNTGDGLWADLHPGCEEGMLDLLERHLIMEEVEIAAMHAAWGLLSLQGPAARTAAAQVTRAPIEAQNSVSGWTYQEKPAFVLCSGTHTGEDGVDFIVPRECETALWNDLADAAAQCGGGPVGLEALQRLRVEAGVPWWGEDLDNSVLMLEAGLDDAISYQKGCYLGQETLARVHFRGHTNKQLTGLRLGKQPPPAAGTGLSLADKQVGRITSAVRSSSVGETIALGYVRRESLEPGTELRVESGGKAVVASLPFVAGGASAGS